MSVLNYGLDVGVAMDGEHHVDSRPFRFGIVDLLAFLMVTGVELSVLMYLFEIKQDEVDRVVLCALLAAVCSSVPAYFAWRYSPDNAAMTLPRRTARLVIANVAVWVGLPAFILLTPILLPIFLLIKYFWRLRKNSENSEQ